jgi:uncharacterized protein (TIGR01777 family)
MIVALTGASGFIGARVIDRLQQEGHTVRALGRQDPHMDAVDFVSWDAERDVAPEEALEDAGAIIHLAGAPVAQRWTEEAKRSIRNSRVIGTRNLVKPLESLQSRPGVLISASAIGYYGDRGEEMLTEESGPGSDFLSQVCIDWEREARQAGNQGLRVVMLRMGIVLGRGGGALKQMLPPFRAGVGGPIGSGKQWTSWIHVEDAVELILFALRHDALFGPVNATAPEPVRNRELAHTLGAVLHRPSLVHTPALGIKLMFGEMASVVLASQRVLPAAALRAGFVHRHPDLREALADVLHPTGPRR